jgi:hypothetical protein
MKKAMYGVPMPTTMTTTTMPMPPPLNPMYTYLNFHARRANMPKAKRVSKFKKLVVAPHPQTFDGKKVRKSLVGLNDSGDDAMILSSGDETETEMEDE